MSAPPGGPPAAIAMTPATNGSGAPAASDLVASWAAGWRLGLARSLGRPLVLIALLGASVAFALGVIEHEAPQGAVDRSLDGVFGWVVPLLCFAVTGMVVGRQRLAESVWCEARFGRTRRWLALGVLAAAAVAGALVSLLAVELTVVTASSRHTALGTELWTCGWITLLGVMCYTALFGAGAIIFRSGVGRVVPLVLDFLLGETTGSWALPWPRAHLRSLLGGDPPLDLPQSAATASLVVLTLALSAVVAWRCRR